MSEQTAIKTMRNCDRYPTEDEATAAFYHYCVECKGGDYLAVARCNCRESCAWRWLFTTISPCRKCDKASTNNNPTQE